MRDQVLCGDKNGKAAIGTQRIGFFPLGRGDDGEGAEEAILRAYRAAGFSGVRGVRVSGTLEFVEYDALKWDARVAGPDGRWTCSQVEAGAARCVPFPVGAVAMIVVPSEALRAAT